MPILSCTCRQGSWRIRNVVVQLSRSSVMVAIWPACSLPFLTGMPLAHMYESPIVSTWSTIIYTNMTNIQLYLFYYICLPCSTWNTICKYDHVGCHIYFIIPNKPHSIFLIRIPMSHMFKSPLLSIYNAMRIMRDIQFLTWIYLTDTHTNYITSIRKQYNITHDNAFLTRKPLTD